MKKCINKSYISNKNGGITLIALVITIIILVILMAVTIVAITENDGILKKALLAKNRYKNSQEEENSRLSEIESQIPEKNEELIENTVEKTEFNYTGSYQEYEVKKTGYYKIECVGARGGSSIAQGSLGVYGGYGGYTSGIIKLEKGEKIYVYVGGHGADAVVGKNSEKGYNGGGIGTWDNSDDESAGAGGGATDIRLVPGEWNNFESLKSRIMVAAGGGGASWRTAGGAGGGLEGLTNRSRSIPGKQTEGYKFGIGQDGYGVGSSDGVAGSGGGYYGGTTSDYGDGCEAGAGGSSFISGYDGCDAIAENSTENNIIHTGQSIHYSKKVFINTKILDGNVKKVNKNDGYSSIQYLGNNYEIVLILDNEK